MIKFFKISPRPLNHWHTFSIIPWKNLNVTLTTCYYCLFSKHWANLTPRCAYVKTHGCLPDLQMRTSLEGLASKNKQTKKQTNNNKKNICTELNWTMYSRRIINDFLQCVEQISWWHCFQVQPDSCSLGFHSSDVISLISKQRSAHHRNPVIDGLINAIASTMSCEGFGFWRV